MSDIYVLVYLLKSEDISKPVLYCDLIYKFKRIVGKSNFSDQFKKIIKRYKKVGYHIDVMRQSACLVVNPIWVYSSDPVLYVYWVRDLQLWFPLEFHNGGSGISLNDGPDVKL